MGELLGKNTQTSANAYASVLKIKPSSHIKSVNFLWREQNVNAVKIKIIGRDSTETMEKELKAETVVTKNAAADYDVIAEPWAVLDFMVASNVAGTHGSIKVEAQGN